MITITTSLSIGTVAATGRSGLVRAIGTGQGRAGEEKSRQSLGELHGCCFLDVLEWILIV